MKEIYSVMRNSKNNGTLKLGCNMNPSTLHFHQHGKPLLESKIPGWTKSHTDRKKSFWNCSQRLDAKGLWHINLRWHDSYQITMSMAWTRNWFRCELIEKNICESVSLYQSHEILWLSGQTITWSSCHKQGSMYLGFTWQSSLFILCLLKIPYTCLQIASIPSH